METCESCKFSKVLVKEGEEYTFTSPVGDEATRFYEDTVLLCRAMPPIAGGFPQVSIDDWCGHYEPSTTT